MGSLFRSGTSARLCSMLKRPDLNASPAAPSQAAGLISLAHSMHSNTRMRFSCVSLSGAAGCSSVPERIAAAQPSGSASLLASGCAGAAVSSIGSMWHIRSVEDALQAACSDAASPLTIVGSSCIQWLAGQHSHHKHQPSYAIASQTASFHDKLRQQYPWTIAGIFSTIRRVERGSTVAQARPEGVQRSEVRESFVS